MTANTLAMDLKWHEDSSGNVYQVYDEETKKVPYFIVTPDPTITDNYGKVTVPSLIDSNSATNQYHEHSTMASKDSLSSSATRR